VRKCVFIFCMMLAAAFIAGCGKKKEEAKPQQAAPNAAKQTASAQGPSYLDRLKALAKKASEDVEASGADGAKTARARELVRELETFDYSGAAYGDEEMQQEPAKPPYLMPVVAPPKPAKNELAPIIRELAEIGLPSVPALMNEYTGITDIEPRRQMLVPFRAISEGRDLFVPFLLEVLENDPQDVLRRTAGLTIQGMVLLQGGKTGELAASVAPQLVAIALRTSNPDVYESALSEIYEFQIRGYALSPDLLEKLRKGLGGAGYSDLRGIMIARCLMEQGDGAGTAFLLGSLQTPTDWAVANWTLHLLGKKRAGEAAETAERFLQDKDHVESRAEAAWTLGNLLSQANLRDRILKALSDALKIEPKPAVYREIAEALAQSGDAAAIELLLDQSQGNKEIPLRIQCIEALGKAVGTDAVKGELAGKIIMSFLEQALRDGNFSVRVRYISALAAASGKAAEGSREKIVAECVSLMRNDPQFAVRAEAATALAQFPDKPVMDYLLEALREEKAQYVKINVIHTLAERRSSEAIKPLIDILKSDNREMVSACAEALLKMEGFSSDMLFDEYLSAGISNLGKINILLCLRQFKDDGRIAQFLLERALPAETNDERRREIIRDIGQRISQGSPLEKEAIDALLGILKSSADTETLRAAIDALGSYGNEGTIEAVIAAAKKDPDVRVEAVRALRRIGKAREDVLLFFLEIAAGVNFENYQIYAKQVEGVAEAVSSLDKAEVSRLIREKCLNEKDPKIRRAALSLSFVLDDPMFDAYLMNTAKNTEEPPDVRSGAVVGLGMRKSHEAVPLLVNMLAEEKGDIAESAAYALGIIGDMKAFRPLLDTIKSLRNGPPQKARLKEIAIFALEQMTGQKLGDNTAAWERWQTRSAAMGRGEE